MLRPLRAIVERYNRRGRWLFAASAFARAIEQLGLFAVAATAVQGDYRLTLGLSVGLGGVFVAKGLARSMLAMNLRESIFGTLAARLMDANLFSGTIAEGHEAEPLIYDGAFETLRLGADTVPVLTGDLAACAVLTAVLLGGHTAQLGVAAAVGLGTAAVLLALTHRVSRGAAERETLGFQNLADGLSCAFRGRLELIASGHDGAFLREQEARTRAWARLALRAGFVHHVNGRFILVSAGLAAVVGATIGESGAQGLIGGAALRSLVLVATASSAFAGAARGALDVIRSETRLQPLSELLRSESNPMGRALVPTPDLPSPIRFRDVSFTYPVTSAPAIARVTFDWQPGELLVFVGANGSGKSTCLRLLLGLLRPMQGTVTVGDRNLFDLDLRQWRRRIAYVPQNPFLPEHASVREAIRLTAPDADDASLERALSDVALLPDLLRKSPTEPLQVAVSGLSAGQRQRLVLARALAMPRPVVLLDEPESNLDAAGVELLVRLARRLRGCMVAIAAHSPELVRAADRVIRLSEPSESVSARLPSAAAQQRG